MSQALVLGAGGITGIAWQFGLLAGLADQGIDPRRANLVVGTSAGAVVGAQLAGDVDLEARYARELCGARGERSARPSLLTVVRLGVAMSEADPLRSRQKVGALAMRARTEPPAARRAVVADWLSGVTTWPEAPLSITATNARTGEFVVFDSTTGVDLVDAVAASCASPGVRPTVTINGEQFYDGGLRSTINVDLAGEHQRLLVLAPLSGTQREIDEVSSSSQVVQVVPDDEARRAVGRSPFQMLTPAKRPAAAKAGRKQAARVAEQVADLWA